MEEQNVHLRRIRMLQEVDYPDGNGVKEWTKDCNSGNSPHASIIKEWRAKNPDSKNKSLCARETGLSDLLLPGGGILPCWNH